MGGAMDLITGIKHVIIVINHCKKSSAPKLLKQYSLPLTGASVVDLLITELGVFEINRGKTPVKLIELAPGVTVDKIKTKTKTAFKVTI